MSTNITYHEIDAISAMPKSDHGLILWYDWMGNIEDAVYSEYQESPADVYVLWQTYGKRRVKAYFIPCKGKEN